MAKTDYVPNWRRLRRAARRTSPAAKRAPLGFGFQTQRRDLGRATLVVERHIDKVGAIGVEHFAGQQIFGFDPKLDLDTGASHPGDAAMDQDQATQQHRP